MNLDSIWRRILSALSVTALVLTSYLVIARPAQLRWGATDAEIARGMPGDALSSQATFLSTPAITVNASPNTIWPWLLQMGYGRAGFYGYDIIENLGSARGICSADRIVPELQRIAVGDPLPLSAAGGLVVNAITPNEFIVWSGAWNLSHGRRSSSRLLCGRSSISSRRSGSFCVIRFHGVDGSRR